MTREELNDYLSDTYPDNEILIPDGFEDAFVGVVEACGMQERAVFSRDRCIDILMRDCGMSHLEAVEV